MGTGFSRHLGGLQVVVVGSGRPESDRWVHVERDLRRDYQRLFGDRSFPERPLAVLLLSDADDTSTMAVADYDDFELRTRP